MPWKSRLEGSIRDRVIIEQAGKPWDTIQGIPWREIERIDAPGGINDKDYRITLTDGTVVSTGQLRGGNIVGYTEGGEKVVKHLTGQVRSVHVLRPRASSPATGERHPQPIAEKHSVKSVQNANTFGCDRLEAGESRYFPCKMTIDAKGISWKILESSKADVCITWDDLEQWHAYGRPSDEFILWNDSQEWREYGQKHGCILSLEVIKPKDNGGDFRFSASDLEAVVRMLCHYVPLGSTVKHIKQKQEQDDDIKAMLSAYGNSPTTVGGAYRELLSIKCFAFGGIGYAYTTSKGELCFRMVARSTKGLQLFRSVLTNGTIEGKLYALCGIRLLDSQQFETQAGAIVTANEMVYVESNIATREDAAHIVGRIKSGFYDHYFLKLNEKE